MGARDAFWIEGGRRAISLLEMVLEGGALQDRQRVCYSFHSFLPQLYTTFVNARPFFNICYEFKTQRSQTYWDRMQRSKEQKACGGNVNVIARGCINSVCVGSADQDTHLDLL